MQWLVKVGHLIGRYTLSTPLVYDYATGGDKLPGVEDQISRGFHGKGGPSHGLGVTWHGATSLFSRFESALKLSFQLKFVIQ